MIRVGSIVLRVDDLARQTAFWTAALDYVPRAENSDDFVLLRPRSGVGPNLSLDRHHSTLQIPPRIHLDLYADDQAAEVRRLIALGATKVPLGQAARRCRLRHPRRPRRQPLLRRRRVALSESLNSIDPPYSSTKSGTMARPRPRVGYASRPSARLRRDRSAASSDASRSAGISIAVASLKMRGASWYEPMNAWHRGHPATCASMAARVSGARAPSRYSISSSTPETQTISIIARLPRAH